MVIPFPVMAESWPTVASLVTSATLMPTAAEMCVPSVLAERPVAFAVAPAASSALSFTAPLAVTVGVLMPLPIEAWFL